jgi:hypothetical protein
VVPKEKTIRITCNPFEIPACLRGFMAGHITWNWMGEIHIKGDQKYSNELMLMFDFYDIPWEEISSAQ